MPLLTFTAWNIHGGLNVKLGDEQFLCHINKYDFILLSETWHRPQFNIDISNYLYFDSTRQLGVKARRASGGLVFYYRKQFKGGVTLLEKEPISGNVIWVKLDKDFFGMESDILIGNVYVPPIGSPYYDDTFCKLNGHVNSFSQCGSVLLMGDFNGRVGSLRDFVVLDSSDYIALPPNYEIDVNLSRNTQDHRTVNEHGTELIDMCISAGLRIINGRFIGDSFGYYTCYQPNGSSVVDYAIACSGLLSCVNFFLVEYVNGYSDHSQIVLGVDVGGVVGNRNCSGMEVNVNPLPIKFKWNDNIKEDYRNALLSDWGLECILNFHLVDYVGNQDGVNKAVDDFTSLLWNAGGMAGAAVGLRIKPRRNEWFDATCRQLKKEVSRWGRQLSETPQDSVVRAQFFLCKKIYFKTIRLYKRRHRSEMLERLVQLRSSDPRDFWKLLNRMQLKGVGAPSIDIEPSVWVMHYRGLQSAHVKASIDFCSSLIDCESKLKYNELTDGPITIGEIKWHMRKLRNGKGSGVDGISNEMLKFGGDILLLNIAKLFNLVLSSGCFPTSWSHSLIISVFKSGNRDDVDNYRGLSLTSCVAKLFTSVLNERLLCQTESTLSVFQSGFRRQHRTSDNLLIIKTLLNKYLNKLRSPVYACFVDFRKAFDSVWRDGLFYKLTKLGLGEKLYRVIKSMYEQARYSIRFQNGMSDSFPSVNGVMQGDCMSPSLFNLFINDLHFPPESCHPLVFFDHEGSVISHLCYADDLVILSESAQGLQNSLKILETYCLTWNLTLNLCKTKVLVMSGRADVGKEDKFLYDGCILEKCTEYSYLGVMFNARGKFTQTEKALCNKGKKAMFQFNKLNREIPIDLSCHLFDMVIRPIITYAGEIWFLEHAERQHNSIIRSQGVVRTNVCQVMDRNGIEKVHNRFCKYVLGMHKRVSNVAVRAELGRLPIQLHIKYMAIKYLFYLAQLPDDRLVRVALKLAWQLDLEGIFTWVSFVKMVALEINEVWTFSAIFELIVAGEIGLSEMLKRSGYCSVNAYEKVCKNKLRDFYSSMLLLEMHNDVRANIMHGNKLRTYRQFKFDVNFEMYLRCIKCDKTRINYTKFRISAHELHIEFGRYKGVPLDERICLFCPDKIVEDEMHVFFHCLHYDEYRVVYFERISELCPDLLLMDIGNQFKFILSSNDGRVIELTAGFINDIFRARDERLNGAVHV